MSAPDECAQPFEPAVFVWPVVDVDLRDEVLMQEALDLLPETAVASSLELDPETRPLLRVCPGARVPGSGGAALVVVCQVRARRCGARTYRMPAPTAVAS